MVVHARRFPATVDASEVADATDIEAQTIRKDVACKVVSTLRSLATSRDDALLLRVLDVYADGATERRDVAAELGITERQYDNARDRLERLITRIPDELRTDAEDVMED